MYKRQGLSFEDAACLPVSATTALQGLRDAGKVQPGQSVLINGASGGVGSFAFNVNYSIAQTQVGTVELFDEAASDGHEILLNSIPVVLQP